MHIPYVVLVLHAISTKITYVQFFCFDELIGINLDFLDRPLPTLSS